MIDPTSRSGAYRLISRVPDSVLGLRLMHLMGAMGRFSKPVSLGIVRKRIARLSGAQDLPVWIMRRAGPRSDTPLPIVVYLHGGGYAIGAPNQDFNRIAWMIEAQDMIVIAPQYRRSLEAPYPAALDDAEAALIWARDMAQALGGRSDQIFVYGLSAGGGLTAALSLRARRTGSVRIAAQFPYYGMLDPQIDPKFDVPNKALIWSRGKNRIAWRLYAADREQEPEAAPSRATDLMGQPPTYNYVGTADLFLRENRRYMAALEAAGVPVTYTELDGAYHAVESIAPGSDTGKAAKALMQEHLRAAAKSCFAPQH